VETPALLSKEEKLRIQLEETYRNEVKKNLENNKRKSFGEKTWSFLNSTLGLWFLSTCVVGLITFLYTKQQEEDRAVAAKKQIDIEHARRNASLVTVLLPYLASQEEKQWRLAIEVTKYLKIKGELPGELESALEGIVIVHDNDTTAASAVQQAKVNAAAEVIDIQKPPAQGNKTDQTSLPPRVYIQIAAESQRQFAKSLQASLRNENFIAPGIENVGKRVNIRIPGITEIRYYKDEEKPEAVRLVALLKNLKPGLQVNETPQKITGDESGVRPRHYEIWFSKW
jgi:hypothetical protein